jgi:hypothetical protein
MSREPNFTGHPGQTLAVAASPEPPLPPRATGDTRPMMTMTAIALYGPPPPPRPPSPQVTDTIACLKAEVRYLERKGRTDRLDGETPRVSNAGDVLPPEDSTVADIVRKAAGMVWDCPPPWEPGPVPASLTALWDATTDGGW